MLRILKINWALCRWSRDFPAELHVRVCLATKHHRTDEKNVLWGRGCHIRHHVTAVIQYISGTIQRLMAVSFWSLCQINLTLDVFRNYLSIFSVLETVIVVSCQLAIDGCVSDRAAALISKQLAVTVACGMRAHCAAANRPHHMIWTWTRVCLRGDHSTECKSWLWMHKSTIMLVL